LVVSCNIGQFILCFVFRREGLERTKSTSPPLPHTHKHTHTQTNTHTHMHKKKKKNLELSSSNLFPANVANKRHLGSAPKSHFCYLTGKTEVNGLSELMTLFIDLGPVLRTTLCRE
jgi:hypothetical protein